MSVPHDGRDDVDPRLARAGLVAGLASLPLAPFVVGLVPAAIGLHASVGHLRFREGYRITAWTGFVASAVGALAAAFSALVWGAFLMGVLLSRSAVREARTWEGLPLGEVRFATIDGATISTDDLRGGVALIDVFAVASPHCRSTLTTLRDFAKEAPEVRIVSWAPDDDAARVAPFLASLGVEHPVAIGAQRVDEPLSLASAKPTLFVVDGDGVIRRVVLGTYSLEGLRALVREAE
jgi:hypothetical protein